jgi:uncharacterized protein (DUF488 family)
VTTIFTMGHSRHAPGHFTWLLHTHKIARLVDVRSHPVSKWAPHFDKGALAQLLETQRLDYVYLGRQLGGRPEDRAFYREDGSVDYALRAAAPDFAAGIVQLIDLARDRRTVILCAEEDPLHCHRRRLVAPALRRAGLTIMHIRGEARLEPDADDLPPSSQGDLFGGR